MRILGFTIRVKREPRYAPYEALTDLYREIQEVKERNTELFKLIEATRVRVYQKSKTDGEQADQQPVASREEPRRIPAEYLTPGADPEILFGGR